MKNKTEIKVAVRNTDTGNDRVVVFNSIDRFYKINSMKKYDCYIEEFKINGWVMETFYDQIEIIKDVEGEKYKSTLICI